MSGSIGGQSNLARAVVPPGALPRIGAAEVGTPCICDCTGTPVAGVNHGSGWSNTGGGGLEDRTDRNPCMAYTDPRGVMCSSDMVVTATFASATLHGGATYPLSQFYIAARSANNRTFNCQAYVFGCHTTGGGAGTAQWELWNDVNAVSPAYTAAGSTPAVGDVIELSAIGSAIVAKLNGATIFSVTDTTIGTDGPDGPTSFASYLLSPAATTDIGVSGFSATPTCP